MAKLDNYYQTRGEEMPKRGFFQKIFGNNKLVASPYGAKEYKTLTAYSPVFTSYSGHVYESELVRAAINAKATNIAKLRVDFSGHGANFVKSRLKNPNDFQSWYQFMYRLATIYEAENSAFIVPRMDLAGRVCELYPVLPSRCKVIEVNGEPWLAFEFRDGKVSQSPIWKVGLMTKFQFHNDVFGETNDALHSTMELISMQNQAISEGVKSAATYRFMAQYNNVAFDDDLKKEQARFNAQVGDDGGMAILFPKTYENIQQINSRPFVADTAQMEMIKQNVFDYFGVNEDVLQGKAFGDQWSAFYETAIEPFAIQFSEVMTRLFEACGELTGPDALVSATSNRMQYMGWQEKLNVTTQLADRGIFNRDDVREVFNLPPLPNGEGQAYIIRGEYKNANEQINGGGADNANS